MKKHLRKIPLAAFGFVTFFQISAWSQENELRSIYIESRTGVEDLDVLIKDLDSQKSARVHLSPLPDQSKSAYGYFRFQFGEKPINFEKLRFSVAGKSLYPVITLPNQAGASKVTLFNSDKERQSFAQQLRKEIKAEIETKNQTQISEKPVSYTPIATAPIQLGTMANSANSNPQPSRSQVEEQKSQSSKNSSPDAKTSNALPPGMSKVTGALSEKSADSLKKENEQKLEMEANEAIKRAQKTRELEELKASEKAKRIAKAKELANQALQAYSQSDFEKSASLFAESTELNPTEDSYYFQYGVSLYKINQFKKSLAILSLADGDFENKNEMLYFKALNHMKLQEYDQALDEFKELADEQIPKLSAASAFFAGSIEFQQEKLDEARKHLEYCIDNSSDADMDKKAESLLEDIDRIESFREKQKEIFKYSLSAGLGYDQNVLNIATQNLASNADAIRFSYGASGTYRLLYDYWNEWNIDFNLNDVYSTTTSLKTDSTIQAADPLVLSIGLPYKRQINWNSRAYNFGLSPSYQSITMSLDGGARKQILASGLLKLDLNYMLNSTWMSAYKIEYSADTSYLSITSSDDDQTGYRMTIGTTQTKLLDQRGSNTWLTSFDYTLNQSQGKNYQYSKWNLGAGYTERLWKDYDCLFKMEYGSQNYDKASSSRADNLLNFTSTFTRALGKKWDINYSAQYSINNSNLSSYAYNKAVLGVSIIYSDSIKKK